MAFDFNKAAGVGIDTIDRSVLGLPFLGIIQKGSPEFDETHKKHKEKRIEGCKPGQILFEPERAILPQPLIVVPIAQTALYTEWKPQGGGIVGNRPLDVVNLPGYRKGTPNTPNAYKEYLGENELVYTIYFLVKFLHGDKWKKGMFAFTSTQLKVARLWSRMLLNVKVPDLNGEPPIFAARWKVGTAVETNAKGSFYNWSVELDRVMDPDKDQAVLEEAFTEARDAQRMLPRPAQAAQATLVETTGVAAGSDPEPY